MARDQQDSENILAGLVRARPRPERDPAEIDEAVIEADRS